MRTKERTKTSRRNAPSPKSVDARLDSSSSGSSADDSDTPKTPDNLSDDGGEMMMEKEKVKPSSRDQTPRASPMRVAGCKTTSGPLPMSSLFVTPEAEKGTSDEGEEPSVEPPSSSSSSSTSSSTATSTAIIPTVASPIAPTTSTLATTQPHLTPEPVTTTISMTARRTSGRTPITTTHRDYDDLTTKSTSSSSSSSTSKSTSTTTASATTSTTKSTKSNKPLLGIRGVNQVQDWIATWIEQDPTTSEQLQLHFLERARTQAHLKLVRASIAEEMETLKKVIHQVYDDAIDLEDDVLLTHGAAALASASAAAGQEGDTSLHEVESAALAVVPDTNTTTTTSSRKRKKKNHKTSSSSSSSSAKVSRTSGATDPTLPQRIANARLLASLTDSSVHLRRPHVPVCGGGCKQELAFAPTGPFASENYPNGEWICDQCESTKIGPRWTCTTNDDHYENCEYDLCCDCAGGVCGDDVDRWDRRVALLEDLAEQPKRWWLNARSDPSVVAIESSLSRRRTGALMMVMEPQENTAAAGSSEMKASPPSIPPHSAFAAVTSSSSSSGDGDGDSTSAGNTRDAAGERKSSRQRKRKREAAAAVAAVVGASSSTLPSPSMGLKSSTSSSVSHRPCVETLRQHKRNRLTKKKTAHGLPVAVAVPGACNMGTTVVGRAIEVQWGRQNEWYPGYVTDFMDNQHCVKYNNGEVEWVTLYKHFDNGVTWQLLPQNMRIKPVESSPMMMLPSSSNDNRPSQQQQQQQRASLVKTAPLAPGNNWAASNRQWRKYHGVKFEHGMYHAVLKLPRSFTKSTTVVSNTTTNVLPKLPSSSTSSITSTSLGFYDTAIEAAVAYDRGARIRWGAESNASGGNGGNGVPLNFQPWERPLENTELFRRDCDSSTDSRNSNNNVHTARSTNAKRQRTSTTINITTGADTTTTTTSVAGGAKAGAAANHSVSFSSTTATKRRAVSSPVQGVGTDSSRKSHSSPIAVGLFRPASKSPIGMMKGRSRHRLCSSPNLDIASPIAD